jgi:hypothetical protein
LLLTTKVEDLSDWTPLQITKKHSREKMYYSYVSHTKYQLDGIVPNQMAAKFVGILPISAEMALYPLVDRTYRSRWEPFVKFQNEMEPYTSGDYTQLVSYAEIKLMPLMQTRYCVGNTTITYDTERRCYILVSKTTTGVEINPLMKKKNAIPCMVVSVYVIYKINENKCRYVAVNISYMQMRDISGTIMKSLLRKRGKGLFDEWLKLSQERMANCGEERPKNCPEMDTLDDFKKKYLTSADAIKTW